MKIKMIRCKTPNDIVICEDKRTLQAFIELTPNACHPHPVIYGKADFYTSQAHSLARMILEMETCLLNDKTWDDLEGDPWLKLVAKARKVIEEIAHG